MVNEGARETIVLTPLPVKSVTLYLSEADGPQAALALAQCEVFAPRREARDERLPDTMGQEYQACYQSARQRLEKILTYLELELPGSGLVGDGEPEVVSLEELHRLDTALGQFRGICSECEQEERMQSEERRSIDQLENALAEFANLNVDLGRLQGGLRFLDIRFGTLGHADVPRLRQALSLIGYTLTVFAQSDDSDHVALAGITGSESALEGVLSSASFRPLQLPAEFRDTPSALRTQLNHRREALRKRELELAQRVAQCREQFLPQLLQSAERLGRAAPYAELAGSLQRRGSLAGVQGWVPADRVAPLRDHLQQRLGGRVVLESREPTPEEYARVPSVVRYPRLLRPFAAVVRTYGVPRYGELDPTWLFALSFVLMFGMMFGDVGQGAVLAAAGLFLPSKWSAARPFAVAAGLASTAFGFAYGSVFGFEQVLQPLWQSPLSDPMRMLTLALLWGVGFILLASVIAIRNRIVQGDIREAWLGGRGFAGTMLYAAILYAGWQWWQWGVVSEGTRLLIGGTLLVVLLHLWRRSEAPVLERVLVVSLEAFENFMSYAANTLSFLRVAAFSLNHVALAVAVFALADAMGPTGHWITVVLGNIFIIVVEGAIVAIQVLRLEYYEGFSRFFAGDGEAFEPLRLSEPMGSRI